MPRLTFEKKSDKIKKRGVSRKKLKVLEKPKREKPVRKKSSKYVKRCKSGKKKRLRDLDIRSMIPWGKVKTVALWIMKLTVTCLFAFVFVWYFGQQVSTVGDSMNPVLSNGDVVFVNRFLYNASSPDRGDIIAFKPKGNENSHYYIKRIIGLPGETVEILEGSIYIDGEKLEESYETTSVEDVGIVGEGLKLGGDEYFVLGDDRNKSEDSRMADIGNVARKDIYGKVWFIISPFEHWGFLND